MLSSFLMTFSIVLPLILWMALGYGIRGFLKLDREWTGKTNNLLFRLLLPLLFFRSTYTSNIRDAMDAQAAGLIVYILAAVAISYLVMNIVSPRIITQPARCGVFIQGSLRSNTAMYSLPLAVSLYGEGNVTIIAVAVAGVVIIFNIASIITLERFRAMNHTKGNSALTFLKSIVTNPLLIGTVGGILLSLSGLTLPAPVDKALEGLVGITTPLSFLVLGAGFSFGALRENKTLLSALALIKLVVYPLVWVVVAILLGYRGIFLASVMLVLAPATSVSAHPMAVIMEGDEELSSCVMPLTSVGAIFTLFLWIFVLSTAGLI